jgi:alginate O-acetyltransferase complex protein AlgI
MRGHLGILGFFKYFHFFEDSLVALLSGLLGRPVAPSGLKVLLPVGISFYTFQSMSYTIDVYRGQLRATRNLVAYAAFVTFFPQLVAGPIVRASHLLPQLARPRRFDAVQVSEGGYLFLWGMFKKVVVADNLAPLVDGVFASSGSGLTGEAVILATYAFTIQIYCDFSGYTDIARGCAKLLGFDFPLNFNLPYAARSPSEFWQRWHISLSTWLRDYLFLPVAYGVSRWLERPRYAGIRADQVNYALATLVTMLLGGLWHGARWTFVAWGAYHGLLLVGWRLASRSRPRARPRGGAFRRRIVPALQWLFFFHLICFGWLLFRAESFTQVVEMVAAVAGGVHVAAGAGLAWRVALFSLPVIILQLFQHRTGRLNLVLDLPAPARGAVYAAWLVGITLCGEFQGHEFIYFQF